ncbi:MAG: RNA methyltransferase [Alistipes sp.]|nr:RNA methyltransferase [Alistipes sp.]MBS6100433.1 RNA methyltransferase [Alistipes sp.]HJI19492.1 RNA methyltransferase [Rikenellaceae bacterium]
MRCVTPERLAAFERAAAMRTRYLTVVAENTYHGQNAAALVRHCEAFGIQQMHTVETLCPFRPSADVVRGTDKWVDIVRHGSTAAMLASLRAAGYRIVATTPHRRSCTPESLDVGAGPIALVFGTEREGISPEVAAAADEFLCIPMCGMVESLNVSASAAIVLYRLSERMRAGAGGWRLAGREQRELVLRWLRGTVRSADDILRRAGFDTDR